MEKKLLTSLALSATLFSGAALAMPSFSDIDADGDGSINQSEFDSWQQEKMQGSDDAMSGSDDAMSGSDDATSGSGADELTPPETGETSTMEGQGSGIDDIEAAPGQLPDSVMEETIEEGNMEEGQTPAPLTDSESEVLQEEAPEQF